jgi:hypothetical protein
VLLLLPLLSGTFLTGAVSGCHDSIGITIG